MSSCKLTGGDVVTLSIAIAACLAALPAVKSSDVATYIVSIYNCGAAFVKLFLDRRKVQSNLETFYITQTVHNNLVAVVVNRQTVVEATEQLPDPVRLMA